MFCRVGWGRTAQLPGTWQLDLNVKSHNRKPSTPASENCNVNSQSVRPAIYARILLSRMHMDRAVSLRTQPYDERQHTGTTGLMLKAW
ncbi:hypothetical protein BaRGS_00036031 [Batillaria attramentaria]|uniref:Uncharacterized protein n=1 Tax=Batillaria attramentaria TaxID=370345 RepID=A0ABD0JE76_9CAEN